MTLFEVYVLRKFITSPPTDETAYRDKQTYQYVKDLMPYGLFIGAVVARIHMYGCITTKDTDKANRVHIELHDELIQSKGI